MVLEDGLPIKMRRTRNSKHWVMEFLFLLFVVLKCGGIRRMREQRFNLVNLKKFAIEH